MKKQVKRVPELKAKIIKQASSPELGRYIWECGIKPQASYSFSIIHALAYSFIGYQTAFLATNWNPIYWNTACLIINSNPDDSDTDGDEDDEDFEEETIEKKSKSADYEKIARALGEILSRGIKVSLVDINKSGGMFKPDAKNNQILYGMEALSQVNSDQISQIIQGRPYTSFSDFLARCPLKKPTMFSLIKSGAFDLLETEWAQKLNVDPRILIMAEYIIRVSKPKKRLTLQNFNGLIQNDILPEALVDCKYVFNFGKYIKAHCATGNFLVFDKDCYEFYVQYFDENKIQVIDGVPCIEKKYWEKQYSSYMDKARDWLKENQKEVLQELNSKLFFACWDQYAKGTISAWEMESLCFYYHEHELQNINNEKYGIVDFTQLPIDPVVAKTYRRNGRTNYIFEIARIVGTVIGKNDSRSSIALLTPTGVVNVKFTKEYYARFKKQISEIMPGEKKKTVKEKSWFKKGTKLMVQGFRRDDTFVAKTYSSTPGHQLYKIIDVVGTDILLTHNRYGEEGE